MTFTVPQRPRVLAVGADAEVCAALHGALERAGHALWCLPSPAELDSMLRLAAPQLVLLVLPASPDASWGNALASAANAARLGVRVVVIAPSREVVEPLAAVAGADRALSRGDVLAHPEAVLHRPAPVAAPAGTTPFGGGTPSASAPSSGSAGSPPPADDAPPLVPAEGLVRRPPPKPPNLAALIDEELEDEPRHRPTLRRVEVNVSLVSEHNFYVGSTRRVDSGGVFISTALPPPVGTSLQIVLGLADGRKLDVEGEVAFVRAKSTIGARQPSGCGVRLHGLPGWAMEAISRFVQARPPIVYVGR